MLSLQDCLDLSDLSEAELAAIVRHERIPPIAALEMGHRLIQTPAGVEALRRFILEDLAGAQRRKRCRDCAAFSQALADVEAKRPDCRSPDPAEGVAELLAIGRAEEAWTPPRRLREAWQDALRDVQDAKERHDCCACGRASLRLLRLLATAGDDAAH